MLDVISSSKAQTQMESSPRRPVALACDLVALTKLAMEISEQ